MAIILNQTLKAALELFQGGPWICTLGKPCPVRQSAVPTSGTQLEGAELNKAGGPGQWQFGPCGLSQNCSL